MDRETKEFLRGLAIFGGFVTGLIITVRVAARAPEDQFIPEEYICPVCGQPFSSSEALESHFWLHTSSVVNMLFKVQIWAGSWQTIWENGQQVSVPTYNFSQISKVGIVAYYFSEGQQSVEQRVSYPDGSIKTGYTAGWQGPRCCYQDRKYCFTYSLPGFRPTHPGVYYGSIKIRGAKDPVSGEYTYTDEINVILLKLLPS